MLKSICSLIISRIKKITIGEIKWLDIQETMEDPEAMVVVVRATVEAMEDQVTAVVDQDIIETLESVQGRKMDIHNTIMAVDGNLHTDAWRKRKWVAEFVQDMKSIIEIIINVIIVLII